MQIEPLKAQINSFQAQLEIATRSSEDVHNLQSSITALSAELAALRDRDRDRARLMESLREELAVLKLARTEGQADIVMNLGIPMAA
jgi:cell division protein FtsB